ncbi:unnamed protein product [Allacma fusca]|uniref:Uncharacterized protein n=1 Tax=Allacma fusca TaxID=39272 RepID=A0A8J2PA93_9HEXA|nr:unnamed protein product [Allacma fusca]
MEIHKNDIQSDGMILTMPKSNDGRTCHHLIIDVVTCQAGDLQFARSAPNTIFINKSDQNPTSIEFRGGRGDDPSKLP